MWPHFCLVLTPYCQDTTRLYCKRNLFPLCLIGSIHMTFLVNKEHVQIFLTTSSTPKSTVQSINRSEIRTLPIENADE